MSTTWWEGPRPATKFAPNFKVPLFIGIDGSAEFIKSLSGYIQELETTIIDQEHLVSSVPKSTDDPYKHTQQWKQHNLFDDVPGLDGDHLQRFPKHESVNELLNLIRINYLEHLANLRYPRKKVYINGWANILRGGEWISKHSHMSHEEAYLSGCYYLTTNNTNLYLSNPGSSGESLLDEIAIKTDTRKLVLFPSWLPHWSDKCEDNSIRMSIAFDIVTETTMQGNPWRPHILFDDPGTMPGLK